MQAEFDRSRLTSASAGPAPDAARAGSAADAMQMNPTNQMPAPAATGAGLGEKDLRKAILPIFYELIAELQAEGADFKQIQSKLVDKLDAAVFEHRCDQEFCQLFRTL